MGTRPIRAAGDGRGGRQIFNTVSYYLLFLFPAAIVCSIFGDRLMMLQLLNNLRAVLEYAGGVIDEPPFPSASWMKSGLWWGMWWAFLLLLIVVFSGQSSKFIYIDF
jgi:hypothetical protein